MASPDAGVPEGTFPPGMAEALGEHPQGEDLIRILAEHAQAAEDPIEAQWTVAESIGYVAMLWHGGMGCPLYRCTPGNVANPFRPGPFWRRPERHSGAASAAAAMLMHLHRNR